jgi:hypothetical protein
VARRIDIFLRLVFFLAAPVVLVRVATLVPITGTLVDVTVAMGVLFLGERIRQRVQSSSLLRRALVSAFAFDDYYVAHPPKPFLYYVFYPVLFPYWLVNRPARQEFLLFKSYNLLSLGVLFATSLYHFFYLYRPELGVREFIRPLLIGFAVESIAVLALLMPLVTTVFELHRRKERSTLYALMILGLLATFIGVARLVIRHQPVVSLETRERVVLRTAKRHPLAVNAMAAALRAAHASQAKSPSEVADDGAVEGLARDAAREALTQFYRADESTAFELWSTKERRPSLMVVFAEGRRERIPIWLGMRSDGSTIGNARELPRQVRLLMKEVGEF